MRLEKFMLLCMFLLSVALCIASCSKNKTITKQRTAPNYRLEEQKVVPNRRLPYYYLTSDGRYLAFFTFAEGKHNSGLWVKDLDTNAESVMVEQGRIQSAAWSSDNKYVAFMLWGNNGSEIRLWNIETRDLYAVGKESNLLDHIAWSPSGKAVSYVRPVGSIDGRVRSEVVLLPVGGTEIQERFWSTQGFSFLFPAWSQNPTRLFFLYSDDANKEQICRVSIPDVGEPHEEFINTEMEIIDIWPSPDGRWTAYSAPSVDTVSQILYLLNIDRGTELVVTNKLRPYRAVAWAPDSKSLVYILNDSPKSMLVYDLSSKKSTPVTTGIDSFLYQNTWLENGRIWFIRHHGDIWSINPDGIDEKSIIEASELEIEINSNFTE